MGTISNLIRSAATVAAFALGIYYDEAQRILNPYLIQYGISPALIVIGSIAFLVIAVVGSSINAIYRHFRPKREPDKDHLEKLLKAYLEGVDTRLSPESPRALMLSSFKDRMLEHFESGYPELNIAENLRRRNSLQATIRALDDKTKVEVSAKLGTIRDQHGFPRSQDRIYGLIGYVHDDLILSSIISKVGTEKWQDFSVHPNPLIPDRFYVDNGDEYVAHLSKDNDPQGFADDLNKMAETVKGDIVKAREAQTDLATTEGKLNSGLKSALDSARISQLKGRCKECSS